MPNKQIVTGEIVTAEPKLQRVAILQVISDQINTDFVEYEKHESAAMVHAMRIGLMMIRARQLMGHGQYGSWLKKSLQEVRWRQAYNFRALAEAWIERQKLDRGEALLLAEPEAEPAERRRVEQLLFDFVGGRSQAELFRDCGIVVRQPKERGGANHLKAFLKKNYPDHPEYLEKDLRSLPKEVKAAWTKHVREKLNEALPPEAMAEMYWRDWVTATRRAGLEEKTWALLRRAQMEEIYGTLIDLKKAMQEALRK